MHRSFHRGAFRTMAACAAVVLAVSSLPAQHTVAVDAAAVARLTAFARLYGYVRYFHPSDEASAIDWDRFAIYGAGRVLHLRSDAAFRTLLNDLFLPLAPTLRLDGGELPTTGTRDYRAWQHLGFGQGENSEGSYRSLRGRFGAGVTPDSTTQLFQRHTAPDAAVRRTIFPGVRLALPLTLATNSGATSGSDTTATRFRELRGALAALDSTARAPTSAAARVADVVVAWNVIQHFYPYPLAGDTWERALPAALAEAARGADPRQHTLAMLRLIQKLEDGHSTVAHPGYRRFRRNGWLAVAVRRIGGKVVVSASKDSLLKVGDELVTVDGAPAEARLTMAEDLLLGTRRRREAVARVAFAFPGERGSSARVTLRRNGQSSEVTTHYESSSAGGPPMVQEYAHGSVVELRPGYFYVDMVELTDSLLAAQLPALTRARGVILDFRYYTNMVPGIIAHLTATGAPAIHLRTPEVIAPDGDASNGWNEDEPFVIPARTPRITAPVVALASGASVSRAETYLSTLRGNGLATVIGEASAGANGGMNWFTTPSGIYISFTGDEATNPDRSRLQRVGVVPQVVVHPTLAGVRAGRDEVLERALQWLAAKGGP